MDLKKLMESKKDQGPLDPTYKDAKMSMLQALLQEMHGMMGNDLHGVKKVEVAAPDKPGLAEGLDQAKDMLSGGPGDEVAHAEPDEEEGEMAGADPYASMSPEELQEHMAMIQAKLGKG